MCERGVSMYVCAFEPLFFHSLHRHIHRVLCWGLPRLLSHSLAFSSLTLLGLVQIICTKFTLLILTAFIFCSWLYTWPGHPLLDGRQGSTTPY